MSVLLNYHVNNVDKIMGL